MEFGVPQFLSGMKVPNLTRPGVYESQVLFWRGGSSTESALGIKLPEQAVEILIGALVPFCEAPYGSVK